MQSVTYIGFQCLRPTVISGKILANGYDRKHDLEAMPDGRYASEITRKR